MHGAFSPLSFQFSFSDAVNSFLQQEGRYLESLLKEAQFSFAQEMQSILVQFPLAACKREKPCFLFYNFANNIHLSAKEASDQRRVATPHFSCALPKHSLTAENRATPNPPPK